jgi:ferredoxin
MIGRSKQPQLAVARVDPIACDGIGMCALAAPGVVALDPWGFPIVPTGPVDRRAARRAAKACPRRAILLAAAAPAGTPAGAVSGRPGDARLGA